MAGSPERVSSHHPTMQKLTNQCTRRRFLRKDKIQKAWLVLSSSDDMWMKVGPQDGFSIHLLYADNPTTRPQARKAVVHDNRLVAGLAIHIRAW
jgi:hypothetical protein